MRDSVDQKAWRNALLQELRWYESRIQTQPLTSIFFGGGTPSLMPPQTVEALIAEARSLFGFEQNIEITLEANPTSVEANTFTDLALAGINRLSLGVQSLKETHLKMLGREHSAEEALSALNKAAKAVPRYSFDLIYALPDQTLSAWQQELEAALHYVGDHLSLYQLTIEPGTQFYHLYKSGKLDMPESDSTAAFYEFTQERMIKEGMPAYEVSNHARSGQESRHNMAYWKSQPYIGIGPGAHGRINDHMGQRCATQNIRSPEKWLKQVSEKDQGQESILSLSTTERIEEALLMGLRLKDGLQQEALPFLPHPLSHLWPTSLLTTLKAEKLIEFDAHRLKATEKGRMILESLIAKLVTEAVLPQEKTYDIT